VDFERLRGSSAVIFYSSHFLGVETIPWTIQTKRFIQTLLILPTGSADAERGFSILKHIKYDRRSRLGINLYYLQKYATFLNMKIIIGLKMLNAMLRVRINGPTIENFNPRSYVTIWRKR